VCFLFAAILKTLTPHAITGETNIILRPGIRVSYEIVGDTACWVVRSSSGCDMTCRTPSCPNCKNAYKSLKWPTDRVKKFYTNYVNNSIEKGAIFMKNLNSFILYPLKN
jgi:hypothetical protein